MVQDDQEIKRKIVKLLDELIQGGKWEGSLFLETWGKKFRDMRDRLNVELGVGAAPTEATKQPTEDVTAAKVEFSEVYISLYQADGLNIKKWEALLSTLGGYNISRPIYKKESDARDAIRNKTVKQNDGYAAIKVLQEDIQPPPPNTVASADRLGHELVSLKEGAIKQKNIVRFIHQSGIYAYSNGTLIKQGTETPF